MAKKCNKFPTLFHFKLGEICRNPYCVKNAINFQILNLVKYVATHMAKKCNKFPTLFHFKVGEICRNHMAKNAINFQHCLMRNLVKYIATHMEKKCNKFPTFFHFKVSEICPNTYGEKMQ